MDNTGIQLNIYDDNPIKLINSLCDWVSKFHMRIKELIESFLSFLEQHNFSEEEITKETLQVYKEYFSKKQPTI